MCSVIADAMNSPIQFSAIVDQVKANKDRSLNIKIETQELSADETSKIFALMGMQIWLAMSEVPVQKVDVPDFIPEFKGQKSPSEILYNRMFVYYKEKHNGDTQGFRAWYETYLDKMGQQFLEKLQ
jgi:hypothetical protein